MRREAGMSEWTILKEHELAQLRNELRLLKMQRQDNVLQAEIERLRANDATAALEAWNNSEKCRRVKIDIDNGFGATCWRVELHRGNSAVYCSETNFMSREGVDPLWHEMGGFLYCCVVDGDAEDFEWPGLAATILHAIECAKKFWPEAAGGDP